MRVDQLQPTIASTAHRLRNGRYRVRVGETIGFRWIVAQEFVPYAMVTIGRTHELRVTVTPELLAAVRAGERRRRRSRHSTRRVRSTR